MLAHQGGWDEFLYAGIPIAIIAGLLALANRRAKRHLEASGGPRVSADPGSD